MVGFGVTIVFVVNQGGTEGGRIKATLSATNHELSTRPLLPLVVGLLAIAFQLCSNNYLGGGGRFEARLSAAAAPNGEGGLRYLLQLVLLLALVSSTVSGVVMNGPCTLHGDCARSPGFLHFLLLLFAPYSLHLTASYLLFTTYLLLTTYYFLYCLLLTTYYL